jgi:hypothetical protein
VDAQRSTGAQLVPAVGSSAGQGSGGGGLQVDRNTSQTPPAAPRVDARATRVFAVAADSAPGRVADRAVGGELGRTQQRRVGAATSRAGAARHAAGSACSPGSTGAARARSSSSTTGTAIDVAAASRGTNAGNARHDADHDRLTQRATNRGAHAEVQTASRPARTTRRPHEKLARPRDGVADEVGDGRGRILSWRAGDPTATLEATPREHRIPLGTSISNGGVSRSDPGKADATRCGSSPGRKPPAGARPSRPVRS